MESGPGLLALALDCEHSTIAKDPKTATGARDGRSIDRSGSGRGWVDKNVIRSRVMEHYPPTLPVRGQHRHRRHVPNRRETVDLPAVRCLRDEGTASECNDAHVGLTAATGSSCSAATRSDAWTIALPTEP